MCWATDVWIIEVVMRDRDELRSFEVMSLIHRNRSKIGIIMIHSNDILSFMCLSYSSYIYFWKNLISINSWKTDKLQPRSLCLSLCIFIYISASNNLFLLKSHNILASKFFVICPDFIALTYRHFIFCDHVVTADDDGP